MSTTEPRAALTVSHTWRVFRRLHRLVVLLPFLGAACSLSVDFDGSHFACTDGQCPAEFRCLSNLCTRLDEPDAGDGSSVPPDAPAAPSCDGPDETFDPTSGHCYFLDRVERIWTDAAAACAARGPRSRLVLVGASAENTMISRLGDSTVSSFVWIGATDAQVEGDWRWLDGADFPPSPQPNARSFVRWHAGEPNNGGSGGIEQNCAAIARQGTFAGDWDDRQCDDRLASICETD
jgi:hypothetical protein